MAGNVFVIFSAEILEFARGGTTPIRTLPDPSGTPLSCSADPTTGNLAVVNESLPSNPGILLIYQPATGTPVSYSDTDVNLYHVGYDNKGNIFVDGLSRVSGKRVGLAELPKGGGWFKNIKLDRLVGDPGSVQWDGTYMTVDDNRVIHRFTVSGSRGKVVGSTRLITHQMFHAAETWIRATQSSPCTFTVLARLFARRRLAFGDIPRAVSPPRASAALTNRLASPSASRLVASSNPAPPRPRRARSCQGPGLGRNGLVAEAGTRPAELECSQSPAVDRTRSNENASLGSWSLRAMQLRGRGDAYGLRWNATARDARSDGPDPGGAPVYAFAEFYSLRWCGELHRECCPTPV